jgi:hypothetical protein
MPLHSALTGADLHAPGAHKTQHEDGGTDEISLTGLTGAPLLTSATTAVTQSPADNSTKVATTAYVDAAAGAIIDGVTFTGDIIVPDEAYDATAWNGSLEVPTKNAIRDKIETMGGGVSDLDDLSDVDLTGQADGDVLTRVAGVWVPETPGAGSSPVWVSSDPRTPPGSPSVDDHEFLTGDTIGGTTLGSPGTAPAIANNRLVITGGTTGSADMKAVAWTAPSTPYVVTARAQIKVAPNTFHVCSVFLRSSVSGVMVTAEILRNAANFHDYYIGYCKYSALTTRGANAQIQTNNDYAFLRVEYNGTNITVKVSTDGNEDNWHTSLTETVGTTFTGGNLPDQFGLGVDSINGSVAGIGFFDYVRIT